VAVRSAYHAACVGERPVVRQPLRCRWDEGWVLLMSQLEQWFAAWRQSDAVAHHRACNWLWAQLYEPVYRIARLGAPEDLARQVTASAFWYAMEELDLMISSGSFLVTASLFVPRDLKAPARLVLKIRDAADPVSAYTRGRLPQVTQAMLQGYESSSEPSAVLISDLVETLNELLRDPDLYEAQRFAAVPLSPAAQALLPERPKRRDLDDAGIAELKWRIELNRILLEDAYPGELAKCHQRETDEDKVWGLVSGRKLGPREPLEWRDDEAFKAFVRRLWVLRCRDLMPRWYPAGVALLPLVPEPEEGEEGVVSEEELPGDLTSPEPWLLAKERPPDQALLELVHDLARASGQLARRPACREVVEATILYIKAKVAETHPSWKDRSPVDVAAARIEDLVTGADLSDFNANGADWRQFLLDIWFEETSDDPASAERNRNRLDQRIRRCRDVLVPILRPWREERGEAL
jgi:hypothetical protein